MILHYTVAAAAATATACVLSVRVWLGLPEGPSGHLACKVEADHASAHCRSPHSSCRACSAACRLVSPAGLPWQTGPSGLEGSNQQWHHPHLHDINNTQSGVPQDVMHWRNDGDVTARLVCVLLLLPLLGVQG